MKKIIDIIKDKNGPTFSFEFFPPKTPKGLENLYNTADNLVKLNPDFISVTYGAGGSTGKSTLQIVKELQAKHNVPCMHHLTLVNATKNELRDSLLEAINDGCSNILALRGDPPANEGKDKFEKIPNGFEYSFELVKLIREMVGNKIGVGVAAFPEGHIEAESLEIDAKHFVNKINSGADLGVTQLFFENAVYFEYIDRLKKQGNTAPIIPGLLPVTDYNGLCNFCNKCGTNIPQSIHDKFKPIADDKEATINAGIEWTTNQALELIMKGAPGIHFYCLNKVEPVKTIWQKILQKI